MTKRKKQNSGTGEDPSGRKLERPPTRTEKANERNLASSVDLLDRLARFSPDDPNYKLWERFCVEDHKAEARCESALLSEVLNHQPPDPQNCLKFALKLFEDDATAQIGFVKDTESAGTCERILERLMNDCIEWFQLILGAANPQYQGSADSLRRELRLALRNQFSTAKQRALDTAAYYEAERETAEQRAARRQTFINPLMKKIGITSDEAWAERIDGNMDRNTPRDYRNGKTKRLRKTTRDVLASSLGISESELPD